MLVFIVILSTIKLYIGNNTFNVIKKKHGYKVLKITRNIESLLQNIVKSNRT